MNLAIEPGSALIRTAQVRDLEGLLELCAEHACYEGAIFDPIGKAEAFGRALFETPARMIVLLAEIDGELVGYASAAPEFSTWRAAEYLHMDCLFVRGSRRGNGIGLALLNAVIVHAKHCGYRQLQWQTPAWNEGAARFYRRAGAQESAKFRYALNVDVDGAGAE